MVRNTLPHRLLVIELANKHQTCAAVGQDLSNRLDGQGGIQGHGHMASHPYRPISHDPMRGVFSPNGDATAGRVTQRLQIACHATHFMHDFRPGEMFDCALSYRLREAHTMRGCFFPVVEPLQGQHVRRSRHENSSPLFQNQDVVEPCHGTWQSQIHHLLSPSTLE